MLTLANEGHRNAPRLNLLTFSSLHSVSPRFSDAIDSQRDNNRMKLISNLEAMSEGPTTPSRQCDVTRRGASRRLSDQRRCVRIYQRVRRAAAAGGGRQQRGGDTGSDANIQILFHPVPPVGCL